MASSPPVKGNGDSTLGGAVPPVAPETPPPTTKWPKWRVTMLVGALILLGAAILDTAAEDVPSWLRVGIFFVGYVFLAYGFFTALSARNRGSTPRDRG